MKINWNIVAIVAPLLIAIIGWAYSIENRLAQISSSVDVVNRVTVIEELITPLIIEYQIVQRLKEMGIDANGYDEIIPAPFHAPGHLEPPVDSDVPTAPAPDIEKIREEAEDWTMEQIKQEAF